MSSTDKKLIEEFEEELEQIPRDSSFRIQPLKRPPRHGVFPWWPAEDDQWVHPEDREWIRDWVPSERVFRRIDGPDGYSIYSYGDVSFRGRPVMWLEVETEGYEIGDQVEIKSKLGKHNPMIADITEILWNRQRRRIEYVLTREGRVLKQRSPSSEFQMVKAINRTLSVRQLKMAERTRLL